jgi:hypothetical protein
MATASLAAIILSACGGGGGGGSSSVDYLEITSGNAGDVAGAVVQTVASTLTLADAGGGEISASPADAAAGAGALAVARYLPLLPQLRRQALGVGPLASVGPVTEPCLVVGFITLSGNVADPGTLSVGDRITADFDMCDDGDGLVTDGRLQLVVRALGGEPLTEFFLIRADVDLTNFVVTENGETTGADGDFELTLDSLAFPVVSTRLRGDSLEIVSGGDTFTLTDFDESVEVDPSIVPFRDLITAVGTLASNLLDGKVDYGATTPIEGPVGDAPESGAILITGANGATIHVVVLSQASVELQLDLDGIGGVDEVQSTTWAELGGAVAPGVTAGNATAVVREALAATAQFGIAVRDAGAQFGSDGAFYSAVSQVNVPGPFGPVEALCQLSGGSAIVTGQLAVPGDFSVGDQFSGTYSFCYQASPPGQFPIGSIVVNGGLDASVTSYTGFGGFFTVGFDGVFDGFNGTTGEFAGTYGRPDPTIIAYSGTSPAVQLTGGTGLRALIMASADANSNSFSSPGRLTRSVGGEMYTATIAGRYTIETLAPLESDLDSDFATGPDTGELKITADNGSAVRVVAASALTARLDLDLDGNGSTDQSITVPWLDLFQ